MAFSRAGVIVMPAAATSQVPVLRAWPDWMPSKPVISSSLVRSLASATLSIRSMSKPTMSPPCLNSKGL